MKKLLLFTILTCSIAINAVYAQYDLKAPVPMDPHVRTGQLANGIVYYIRENKEPKDRASFYIIRDAGALLENDKQNGLAHFLEHMAFNGTQNFPEKGIIKTLEKYGVAFGRNINAYTAQNETVYNLSDVPTNNVALLDTCLLILHDWSYYLSLDNEEIDAERGVISEEWRTRRNSRFRLNAQTSPVIFKGSQYAMRDVIGDLDVIKNFDYQTLKNFYYKWYRTDLEAIAVVGDFDVAQMEEKIKTLFSEIPAVKNPEKRPFFEIPEHDKTYFVVATDKEAQQSAISIYTKLKGTPENEKNHEYLRNMLINNFYNSMLNTRISELLQKGNPPFVNGGIGISGFVRGYDVYYMSATAKPNEEAIALETILTENERVLRHGFTDSELERVKTNMLTNLESAYKEKDKTENENYISEMQSHFLEGEPLVDFDYYYTFAKTVIPTITVEEVSAMAKKWNTDKNKVVVITGPSEDATHLTQEEAFAIMDKVKKVNIEAYKDETGDASLINEELKGGKIIATKALPEFEAEEWTLSNGAKVVFRKADYEKDQVSLSSYSKGGTSLYDVDMLPSANVTANFSNSYGLGDFDAITLKKILTGKKAGCQISINNLSESVNGYSTPNDLETMLQLLYLTFENPRFDKEAHEALMSRNRALIMTMEKNPQKVLQDSLSLIMSNYNPRTLPFNEKYLDNIDIEKIEKVYRDRIKDASDFVFFIVGNIDAETAKPLVEKYIGSIKSENRKENWIDNKVRRPEGHFTKEIEISLETPKSTVITSFSKYMDYSIYNNLRNSILKGILDLRYTENIREKEGGTYGVGVQANVVREPYQSYSMIMTFDCDPEKANHLKSLIYKETEKLMQEGPTQEEVNKIVQSLRKNREQSKPHNDYWADALYTWYVAGINTTAKENFDDILDKVTPADIQKFAQELFKDADVVDVIFKPKQ